MAGRVLSARNEGRLREALAALEDVLASLGDEQDAREARGRGRRPSFERRTYTMAQMEVRAEGDTPLIGGYAVIYDRKSVMLSGFKEKIMPGAFAESLSEDIRALWQHDDSQVLGRTASGTLRLWEDARGVGFEVKPPDTQTGRDAVTLIARGDVDQMSFGFTVPIRGDEWSEDEDGIPLRIVKKAKLIEVSPVTFPAYLDTSAQVMRSAPEWVQRALAQGVENSPDGEDRDEIDSMRARLAAQRERMLTILSMEV